MRSKELTIEARVENLCKVLVFVDRFLKEYGCAPKDKMSIDVAVEEIFVNIASYAYDGKEGDAEITFSFNEEDRVVEMVFSDSGFPFDPTSRPQPKLQSDPGKRPVGGLGIHIVRQTMDKVNYDYLAGRNILTIRKHI